MSEELNLILKELEESEKYLSYGSKNNEEVRKSTGSFYTPIDVATFFWHQFFYSIANDKKKLKYLLKNYIFIEPSFGSGILFFSFVNFLENIGISKKSISKIKFYLVDINKLSVDYGCKKVKDLENEWGVSFVNLKIVNKDFLKFSLIKRTDRIFIFGNPPFVKKKEKEEEWRNTFADFVDKSLQLMNEDGYLHFIIPLSFSFSKEYKKLRNIILNNKRKILISNFDNIPDSLFKFGKPKNSNSNKSNSQRCSIITISPNKKRRVLSSKLISWKKDERKSVLSSLPTFYDVYTFSNNQYIRPYSKDILDYLKNNIKIMSLKDLTDPLGKYELNIASVARNFISFREKKIKHSHSFYFKNKNDFLKFLAIINSDLFFEYWKTFGDGFHLTKQNIYEFPIDIILYEWAEANLNNMNRIWKYRKKYIKINKNSSKVIKSYDFSRASEKFISTN